MAQNQSAALLELWKTYNSTLQDPDDVDLITIDIVLRQKAESPIPSPYNSK